MKLEGDIDNNGGFSLLSFQPWDPSKLITLYAFIITPELFTHITLYIYTWVSIYDASKTKLSSEHSSLIGYHKYI